MSWLERLKKLKTPTDHPTETTKTVSEGKNGVSVVSVGYAPGAFEKFSVSREVVNNCPETLPPAPKADPDRATWPHSVAMNRAEIERLVHRLALFDGRGMTVPEAESVADKLVARDREEGDRTSCAECHHLYGWGPKTWRCCGPSWQGNTLAGHPLARDWLIQLHRCPGFTAHTGKLPAPVGAEPPPAKPRIVPPAAKPHLTPMDRAYLKHHSTCPVCQAAGRGGGTRCHVGLSLHMGRWPML